MATDDQTTALILAAAAVFIFLPVVMLVQFSFQDGLVPVPPFKGFSLRWYDKMFADRKLMEALGNSVLVGGLSSLAATLLGFLAAFKLARGPGRGAPRMQFLLMAPITVSYIIIALGLLIVFNGLGFGKSLLAVGIGHVVINLPLCFAVIYSQMGEHQANVERAALDLGASALILVHNHPSGDPLPSRDDVDLTRRLVQAGEVMGIDVLDHVILADTKYFSFKEAGRL